MIGTDVSQNQLANAIQRDNIEYRCVKGEDLSFLQSNSVDLVTIATALHWLDLEPGTYRGGQGARPPPQLLNIHCLFKFYSIFIYHFNLFTIENRRQ